MNKAAQQKKQDELTPFEQVANVVGAVAAIWAITEIIKAIARKTDTNIISNDARRVLQDKDKAIELRKAIDTYHVTGDWKDTKINEIL